MSLPESGWKGHGRPGYRCDAMNAAADQLRRAAILSDNAGHALREVAFSKWLYAHPQAAGEVLMDIERIGITGKRL